MTIRSRLLFLLLPPLFACILLISFFFYVNWSHEIVEGFQWRLQSAAQETSPTITSAQIEQEIDLKLNRALIIILFATLIPFIIIIITVFLIANRISQPVQRLSQAALDIAAGNYETNIHVQGPREIVELSNAFHTMSECLADHIHRLKETSITRNQLYGEQECSQILQNYMLQKELENFNFLGWRACIASTPLTSTSNGLLLKIQAKDQENFEITLIESAGPGFHSLFQLNRSYSLSFSELKHYNYIHCIFEKNTLHYSCQKMPNPLGWYFAQDQWITEARGEINLGINDLFVLYNSALLSHFKSEESIRVWLGRVLRHFGNEGLDHIQTILNNELNFLKRRENAKDSMAIIIFMRVS